MGRVDKRGKAGGRNTRLPRNHRPAAGYGPTDPPATQDAPRTLSDIHGGTKRGWCYRRSDGQRTNATKEASTVHGALTLAAALAAAPTAFQRASALARYFSGFAQ